MKLTWVSGTSNIKTGDIPTAYVGETVAECRDSCKGCPLLERTCYAWNGMARASLTRIERRRGEHGDQYTLDNAIKKRSPGARCVRIGAMGDPARADGDEILSTVNRLLKLDLPTISYTHFWREPWAQHLKGICLASCEDVDEADEAITMGWVPALLLPWDYMLDGGSAMIETPAGNRGVVCVAQTKPGVTCNDCRMCWLGHPVWAAGKISMIGFIDHSRAANRERRRWLKGTQLPVFDIARPDTRPAGR